jgi:hypothetical protein
LSKIYYDNNTVNNALFHQHAVIEFLTEENSIAADILGELCHVCGDSHMDAISV